MKTLLLLAILFVPHQIFSQPIPDSTDDMQFPDTSYNPPIGNPAYPWGKGPVVFIDEGHHNYHTIENRYRPFALLLEKDGYVVKGYKGEFTRKGLNAGKVLVVANALNGSNVDHMYLPTPSAFSKDEIEAVRKWVSDGGSLFLIADHMPWPGANADLASVFGFTFYNGFNFDVINPSFFRRSDKTIRDNVITRGRKADERVSAIPNTEGQAFQIPPDATPILVFNNSSFLLMPDTSWVFHENTRMIRIEGWSQGAFKTYGKGRVVVFGEASMFTAQLGQPGGRKMGMNRCDAGDCHMLLLNSIHWLDGIL